LGNDILMIEFDDRGFVSKKEILYSAISPTISVVL